ATVPASTGSKPQLRKASLRDQRIAWSSSTTRILSFVFFSGSYLLLQTFKSLPAEVRPHYIQRSVIRKVALGLMHYDDTIHEITRNRTKGNYTNVLAEEANRIRLIRLPSTRSTVKIPATSSIVSPASSTRPALAIKKTAI